MPAKRSASQRGQDLAFTMPARPIGYADLIFVQTAIADVAPDWSVEMQGICADETTLVLLPEDADDAMGPSFMISRETYGFRLDQVHWDLVTDCGVFASLSDVVVSLGARLAFYPEMAAPILATVH